MTATYWVPVTHDLLPAITAPDAPAVAGLTWTDQHQPGAYPGTTNVQVIDAGADDDYDGLLVDLTFQRTPDGVRIMSRTVIR